MGLEMHFVAKSLKTVEVPESSFEIHSSMKVVNKAEMAKNFSN